MKKCAECNSEKIIKDALVIDRGDANSDHILQVAVDEKPSAFVFKNRMYSDVKADVCADCGYISFYAIYPENLWTTYQNRK